MDLVSSVVQSVSARESGDEHGAREGRRALARRTFRRSLVIELRVVHVDFRPHHVVDVQVAAARVCCCKVRVERRQEWGESDSQRLVSSVNHAGRNKRSEEIREAVN